MKLKDKVALVTGGGRGIGAAIATALAAEGADVAVAARTASEVNAVEASLKLLGRRAKGIAVDVSVPDEVARLIAETERALGPVDILVNDAGVLGPVGPAVDNDPQAWLDSIQVNLGGVFLTAHAVLPGMIARGRGKIINLSGGGAAGPRAFFSAYAAAKAAVARFTECLAEEVRPHGIQVNAIAPGPCNTRMFDEMVAVRDRGGPDNTRDVDERLKSGGVPLDRPAALVVYLASDESGWLTGRLISAIHDDWRSFDSQQDSIAGSEMFTLRRLDPHTLRRVGGSWPPNK